MARANPTDPLGDETDDGFSFSDATLLTFLGVAALVLVAVFLLGSICAEHRIVAVLATI